MTREVAGKVEKDRVIAVELRLTDESGEVLDETTAAEPLVYLHGRGAIPKALETAFEAREVGDRFEKELSPEELVGPRTADADRAIPVDAFAPGFLPAVGTELQIEEEDATFPVWVVAAGRHHVRVTLDHPWAGRSAKLTAEVLRVRRASPGELKRGAPDGIDPRADEEE